MHLIHKHSHLAAQHRQIPPDLIRRSRAALPVALVRRRKPPRNLQREHRQRPPLHRLHHRTQHRKPLRQIQQHPVRLRPGLRRHHPRPRLITEHLPHLQPLALHHQRQQHIEHIPATIHRIHRLELLQRPHNRLLQQLPHRRLVPQLGTISLQILIHGIKGPVIPLPHRPVIPVDHPLERQLLIVIHLPLAPRILMAHIHQSGPSRHRKQSHRQTHRIHELLIRPLHIALLGLRHHLRTHQVRHLPHGSRQLPLDQREPVRRIESPRKTVQLLRTPVIDIEQHISLVFDPLR